MNPESKSTSPLQISVIGCGWYGMPLALELKNRGHIVLGSTRNEQRKTLLEFQGVKIFSLNAPLLPSEELLNSDIIVLNIPLPEGKKEWFDQWKWNEKSWVIFISSTSGLLADSEEWIQHKFKNWTILRFGGLIGNGRHPAKTLSGKDHLTGRLWPVNLLHQQDAVGITCAVIEKLVQNETIVAVSAEHHSREEFYHDQCLKLNLPPPKFDPNDHSIRMPLDHCRAFEIYTFKWPTMIGKSL